MAFNYLPSVMQVPQLDYSQGMQQQQQGQGLGGLQQLLGGLQAFQASRPQQAQRPEQASATGVGYGLGQDLVSASPEIGESSYAKSESPASGGGFLEALQSIMLGGGAGSLLGGMGKTGAPGLDAVTGLASKSPVLSSLIGGGLGQTLAGKLGGLR